MASRASGAESPPAVGHVVPVRVLAGVLAALLVLTWLTVAATGVDWGGLNLWIAIGIATVKASLVLLYFMHLRYESPLYGFVLVTALAFVALFIGFAMLDTAEYQPELVPGYAPGMERRD